MITIQGGRLVNISEQDILNSGTRDFLGRPVFSDVILFWKGKKIALHNAVCRVDIYHSIVLTSFSGRKGTVKEEIAADDYRISISGTLQSDEPEVYPINKVKTLNEICNCGEQIDVVSEYLAMFEIYHLVCSRKSDSQIPGSQNVHPFELEFLSDEDVQLVIEQEK